MKISSINTSSQTIKRHAQNAGAAVFAALLFAATVAFGQQLTMTRSGDSMILSWPLVSSNLFYLQFATNLSEPIFWSNASDPITNGSTLQVAVQNLGVSRFYRLKAWQYLFDGTSTAAFRGYKQDVFPPANIWTVTTNGELMSAAVASGSTIKTNDLITKAQYQDFELRWEWKCGSGGNSGVIIRVTEPSADVFSTQTGPEYQLDDDASTADGKTPNRSVGSAYGLFAPSPGKVVSPLGQWNECRITVQSNHVEHWLNGLKVVEYDINGAGWSSAVASYPNLALQPDFAQATPSAIALQHHGSQTWFRNIMIRPLSSP